MSALDEVRSWITLRCSDCGDWVTGTVFELQALGWALGVDGKAQCRKCWMKP